MLTVVIYSTFLYNKIILREKDIYKTIMNQGHFHSEYNDLKMDDFNFMPFLDIK